MQSKQERVGLRPHPFLFIAILAGCASQLSVPVVTITQVSAIAPLRISAHTAVPVDYRLEITNPLDNAVTLKSVEIETVGRMPRPCLIFERGCAPCRTPIPASL
jgi:hypothetical protein